MVGSRDTNPMEHEGKRKNLNGKPEKYSDHKQEMRKNKHVHQEMDDATEGNDESSRKRPKRSAESDIKAMEEATETDREAAQYAHQKGSRPK
ncbi:hypothetical protein OSTOST_07402, partial [Ostertagia ostertagi]